MNIPTKFKPLDDLDLMPWGMYRQKGIPLQDIPASYFHHLWTTGKNAERFCPVADYIRRNLHSLKKEYPDGIWS